MNARVVTLCAARALVSCAVAASALCACARDRFVPEVAGGVRCALPALPESRRADDAAAGFVERHDAHGSALVGWDADARALPVPAAAPVGPLAVPADDALVSSGLAAAHDDGPGPEVEGHHSERISSGDARALVWRCDKSGRTLRLVLQGAQADPARLDALAAQVRCHRRGERPVNGDVPAASAPALGPGFTLAHRSPASATWLRDDAVLTLFAGQVVDPPRDLVEAAHVAPGWARAAGLGEVEIKGGQRVRGPQQHPGLQLTGTAVLDRRPVRFSLLFWRCAARARTYAALVLAEPSAAGPAAPGAAPAAAPSPAAGAAPPGAQQTAPAPASVDWTGHDAALLAARCHS